MKLLDPVLEGVTGYGDWSTSPYYVLLILFGTGGTVAIAATNPNILGALATIIIAIAVLVVLAYMVVYMPVLKDGEGGTPAFMKRLVERFSYEKAPRLYRVVMFLGSLSIALLTVDSALTTVITQFGGYEGVKELPQGTAPLWIGLAAGTMALTYFYVSNESWKRRLAIPAIGAVVGTIVFLVIWKIIPMRTHSNPVKHYEEALTTGLVFYNCIVFYSMQKFGVAKICRAFGPIMLAYAGMLFRNGIWGISQNLAVLDVLNPLHIFGYAFHFLGNAWNTGGLWAMLGMLAIIFLALTGGEAPFADAAAIGKVGVLIGAFIITIPVVINYLGQGAVMMVDPTAVGRSFYALVPPGWQGPAFTLGVMTSNVACQALTTALFVMVSAQIERRFLPDLGVVIRGHNDAYCAKVNWGSAAVVMMLAFYFRGTDEVSGAYGFAVSGTMMISAVFMTMIMRLVWGQSKVKAFAIMTPILIGNALFFVANATKLHEPGTVAVAVLGLGIGVYMFVHHMRTMASNPDFQFA